ncbi:MAG TPA: lysylphosphatidylglycerol synthase transmembrane domain-containing protein [Ignavibacteriaceae bacterium]|nr:lysylphosphatidylglycerol synthase transmembrane domain-containing protein [Ignavibacteriaceae bacterium]
MISKKINKAFLYTVMKIILSAVLIIFLFDFIAGKNLLISLKTAEYSLIAAAFLLMFFNLYLQFSRWRLTCESLLNEKDGKKILRSLFHGFPAGAVTPGRIGEYFARGIVLQENSASKIAVSVFIEKLFPLIPVFLFGLLSFTIFLNINPSLIFSLFLLLVVLGFILFKRARSFSFSNKIIEKGILNRGWLKKIFSEFGLLGEMKKSFIIKMIILSALFYFCYIIQYALLVSAFSGNFYLVKYMWAGSLLFFIKAFIPPVTYGDLGIREGVSVYFITKLGENAAAGLNASLFLFFINLLIPSLAGAVLLFTSRHTGK